MTNRVRNTLIISVMATPFLLGLMGARFFPSSLNYFTWLSLMVGCLLLPAIGLVIHLFECIEQEKHNRELADRMLQAQTKEHKRRLATRQLVIDELCERLKENKEVIKKRAEDLDYDIEETYNDPDEIRVIR